MITYIPEAVLYRDGPNLIHWNPLYFMYDYSGSFWGIQYSSKENFSPGWLRENFRVDLGPVEMTDMSNLQFVGEIFPDQIDQCVSASWTTYGELYTSSYVYAGDLDEVDGKHFSVYYGFYLDRQWRNSYGSYKEERYNVSAGIKNSRLWYKFSYRIYHDGKIISDLKDLYYETNFPSWYRVGSYKSLTKPNFTYDPGIPRFKPPYDYAKLKEDLFVQAYSSIPKLEMNNLDNVLRIIDLSRDAVKAFTNPMGFLRDVGYEFVKDRTIGDVAKLMGSGWLRYRYEVNTTKADFEELQTHLGDVNRFNLGNTWYRAKTGATVISQSDGSAWELVYEFFAKPNVGNAWSDFYRNCASYGVLPTATNLWDMVPMSFIFDWLTTSDDVVKRWDISQELKANCYNLSMAMIGLRNVSPSGLYRNVKIISYNRSFASTGLQYSLQDAFSDLKGDLSWVGWNKNTARRSTDLVAIYSGIRLN